MSRRMMLLIIQKEDFLPVFNVGFGQTTYETVIRMPLRDLYKKKK